MNNKIFIFVALIAMLTAVLASFGISAQRGFEALIVCSCVVVLSCAFVLLARYLNGDMQ